MAVGIQCVVGEFLDMDKVGFVTRLKRYIESHELPVSPAQLEAWADCFDFLKSQLENLPQMNQAIPILFEYMLPLEKGRRPDVILLLHKKVIVLEFKMKNSYNNRDIEQVIGYREDLRHFQEHTVKNGLDVEGYLVLTSSTSSKVEVVDSVSVLTHTCFESVVKLATASAMGQEEVKNWLESSYYPVPSIVESTQKLFLHGSLPYIKSIAKGDITTAVNGIRGLISEGKKYARKRIIFLSGVPGAGKTLVGLKTVYDYNAKLYKETSAPIKAVYLSGNGPLVNVLQTQLSTREVNGIEGKAYIKGMLEFKKEYLETDAIPLQEVIVFDEAQRAWDTKKMNKPYSEAEALLKMADKVYDKYKHVTVLCLIGEGQAIHTGEERGLTLWTDALSKRSDWEVFIPNHYSARFAQIPTCYSQPELYLDTSIRTNFVDISKWIEAVLEVNHIAAAKELKLLRIKGLRIRIMRDFDIIESAMRKMKETYPNRKYGLLVSSKTDNAINRRYTKPTYETSFVKDKNAGKWFMEDCEELKIAASEFLCQGLEIDMPIVMFGGDYLIKDNNWNIDYEVRKKHSSKFEDIETIMKNIYRVLLSRGRQGMILFIPKDKKFDQTYRFFKEIGVPER